MSVTSGTFIRFWEMVVARAGGSSEGLRAEGRPAPLPQRLTSALRSSAIPLYVKHRLTGTAVEPLLLGASWAASAPRRHRHPELWALHLEDRRMRTVLKHLIEPDWSCVDVGAHIGSVLVQLLRLAPHGSHIALEPSPKKAHWLASRFDTVEVHQIAAGEVAARADFYEDIDRPGFSGLGRLEGRGGRIRTYEVQVETLDSVVRERRVHFIKLDVEGAELPALRGAVSTLERCRPSLLFECGPAAALEPFGYDRADLHDFLVRQARYDVYSVEDFLYGREPMSLAEFRKAGTYPFPGFNYVALPVGAQVRRLL